MDINLIFIYGMIEPLRYFTDRMAAFCKENNVDHYILDLMKPETFSCDEFRQFLERPNTFAITINGFGVMLKAENGENIWKERNIPVYSLFVDHPRNYDSFLKNPPCDLHVLAIDKNHEVFIRRFYPSVKDIVFCPDGGSAEDGFVPYENRVIDVIYMGGCQNKITAFPQIPALPGNGFELFSSCIERLIQNPGMTAEETVYEYLEKKGIVLNEDTMYHLMVDANISAYIEDFVRRYFKLKGIKALDDAGIKVDIYGGESWQDDEVVFSDNITLHDWIPNKELNTILGSAKISLCFMPWYKRGCSEKALDSMLNGAVCISDTSEYLQERYIDGENIVYFDLCNPEQMAMDVKWLLEHPAAAKQIAQKGYETALEHDTWGHRMELILKEMKKANL